MPLKKQAPIDFSKRLKAARERGEREEGVVLLTGNPENGDWLDYFKHLKLDEDEKVVAFPPKSST